MNKNLIFKYLPGAVFNLLALIGMGRVFENLGLFLIGLAFGYDHPFGQDSQGKRWLIVISAVFLLAILLDPFIWMINPTQIAGDLHSSSVWLASILVNLQTFAAFLFAFALGSFFRKLKD